MDEVEMIWNDRFPPLNLYNFPLKNVDVFARAKLLEKMPKEAAEKLLYGENKVA